MYIPRVFYIEPRFKSREPVEHTGLELFITGLEETIDYFESYVLKFHGLILHDPSEHELFLVTSGEYLVFTPGYSEYCKWHNGPLDRRDDPLRRIYCLNPMYTRLGYCREHNDTIKAIYDRCFTTTGIQYMGSCKRLDEKLRGKLKYTLYILDYGHGMKVGVTRSWRIYDRVGEQPHIIAAKVLERDSAYEIRDLEVRIGSKEGFTERPHKRSLKDILSHPPKFSFRRITEILRRLSRELNFSLEEASLFKVLPEDNIALYVKAREVPLYSIVGRKLELMGYWAGYMLLADPNTNAYYLLKSREVLHKNSVGAVK